MPQSRILVAAGQTLFRHGLAALIRADVRFTVTGQAADADEARRFITREGADVILLDAELPGSDGGCNIIACLRALCPGVAIVVLGEADRAAHTETEAESALRAERSQALAQGAVAYLPARADSQELLRLLCAVAARTGCGPTDDAQAPAEAHDAGNGGRGRHRVTEREQAIIALIAQGLCNKEVAHRLGISAQTVKNHVSHLLEQLALADRTQLAVYAVERHFEF